MFTAGAAESACLGERGDARKRRDSRFTVKAHSERFKDKERGEELGSERKGAVVSSTLPVENHFDRLDDHPSGEIYNTDPARLIKRSFEVGTVRLCKRRTTDPNKQGAAWVSSGRRIL